MTMKKTLAAIAGVSLLLPTLAFASVTVGQQLGSDDIAIMTGLEAAGYTEIDIEREYGEIEVEAMLNGEEFDLVLSADTGEVLSLEAEGDQYAMQDEKMQEPKVQ